ncbi:MAG: TrmB family transcriptional regulator [Deltaproteobacteria bacterium]|nr:TrmB family transcriptional regulator [Deltaproteobacteria bacterium]
MVTEKLKELGFSQYEIAIYLALVANHPANGSQLSRLAGVARSRVYDVLRNMTRRGLVDEVGNGFYLPLPPEELIRRLKTQFESNLASLKEHISRSTLRSDHDHVWTIRGYGEVMDKARDMINSAQAELYVRLFPEEGRCLDPDLHRAEERGVEVKYVALGQPFSAFAVQVLHPHSEKLVHIAGGRSLDLIVDRIEALSGLFKTGQEELSPINWSRNWCFVSSIRDGLRHDFFHYFLHKTYDLGQPLSQEEEAIYKIMKEDY